MRATVDDTGATVGSQDFTVYGEQLTGTGTFGYAGEQQDPTGLIHLRARQYNPGLGRFTTVDPVQPGAPATTGYNLYAYSGNNPTTWTDPTGAAALSEYVTLSKRGAAIGGLIGFGVGSWICADGLGGLSWQEARCIAAYTVGGAVFGAVGPTAGGLGPVAACAVGAGLGVTENTAVSYAAGQGGPSLRSNALAGGVGCGFWGLAALLRKVDDVAEETAEELAEAANPGKPAPRQLDELGDLLEARARQLELGMDPATGFNQLEGAAAVRFEQLGGIRLTRHTDPAFDWIDDLGRTYDAVGPVPINHFELTSFLRSLDQHVFFKQGLDVVIVDLNGLTSTHIDAVMRHIASMPTEAQGRIVRLGF